ncbi:nitroreductase family deazaflavin-dependent oxidoreductase [Actinomadura sp. HBU206391]|uniref:nitroreductase family deazaflavin-dependent oxidoreductase n=1 Tax=Actinomadura sp. HBU206391 TaxID=2731692 RepID=UPI00164FF541|nr:nitroreductase family deazaflavin-dependent oxidoreductase [Actinomadura sp. HBU206391]MBC6456910.1 nitroreductase family deazaflavin-dependent oxidoreductase [Actinomadura sp. HBU206391]
MSIQRRLARFNRMFANRIVGRVIPRLPGFGAVHHRGRRSGREYRTPVKVFRRGDLYVLSLPYGSDSDWVKNVLAAGGCDLMTRGRRVPLVEPRLYVDDEQAEIPALIRRVLIRINATDFLALRPREVPRIEVPGDHAGQASE